MRGRKKYDIFIQELINELYTEHVHHVEKCWHICLISLYWTTICYITVHVEHTQNFVHRNELIRKKTQQSRV